MKKLKLTKTQSKRFLFFLGISFLFLIKKFLRYETNSLDTNRIVYFLFLLSMLLTGVIQCMRVILEPQEGGESKYGSILKFLNNKITIYFSYIIPLILLILYMGLIFLSK